MSSLRHGILLLFSLLYLTWMVEAATRINSFVLVNESQQRRLHRTDKFRSTSWIIARRGNNLSFRVTLDSALDEGQSMSLQVSPFAIFDNNSVSVNHAGGGVYDITARLLPDAPLGTTSVGVRLSNRTFVQNLPKQVFILCDPWNVLDITHYPVPSELEEYVNNEHGITYRGTSFQVQDVRWAYLQFDHSSLLVTAYIVNKLGEASRKNPGLVARHITAMMTQQETHPDGMMVGKWEGGFAGGSNPSAWSSSSQIIRQYIAQGMRPVRFAQCWVFGAVYQTLSRALGMPTRQVAAFDCAHEKPERVGVYTQSLARYWDRNTRSLITDLGAQIWNFHSFNEIWLHNLEAPPPYNLPEWHTVDATPQEHSDGEFKLGPANTRAVRDGRKIKFDTSFVTSEVSARYHNYLVSCPFFFGRSMGLPPSCSIVQDMGPEPTFPTGTYIVAKSVRGFTQDPLTHRYHTRRTGGIRNAVRAFDTSTNGVDLRSEVLVVGNHLFEPTPEDSVIVRESVGEESTPVSSGAAATRTARTLGVPAGAMRHSRSRRHLMERSTDSGKFSQHASADTGLAMGIVMPAVLPGEPIEVIINLGCEGATEDLQNSLTATNRARRHIVLNNNGHMVSPQEPEPQSCPERVLASLRAVATLNSHTGAPGQEIANVKANAVLHAENGHFNSIKLTLTNYVAVAGGVREGYVGVTVFATDHSTGVDKDIVLFGSHSMAFLVPKVSVHLSADTIEKGQRAEARLAFTNPLSVPLTNAKLHIAADNLGFEDLVVDIGTLAPLKTFLYTHTFDTEQSLLGLHFYHATLVSDTLFPALGEVAVTITEKL